jgi:hypothetical protein
MRLKEYHASLSLVACCISYAILAKNVKLFEECLQRFTIVSSYRPSRLELRDPNFILRTSNRLKSGKVRTLIPFLFLFLFLSPFHNFVNNQLIINGEIAYEWREQTARGNTTHNLGLYLEALDRGKVKGEEFSGRNGATSQFLNGLWDIKKN